MTVPTSPMILTPADFADTGQWRLIIYVSVEGMCAVLRHVSDTSRPAVQLFNEHWDRLDGRELLDKIENVVYDHPSVLDDYATEIVVESSLLTWAPTEILRQDDFADESIYKEVFPDIETEVMADQIGKLTSLYSFTPGFDGFMARTIPGSRIRSHLGVLFERLCPDCDDGRFRIYIDIRSGKMDVLVFHGDTLLCTSVQSCEAPEKIAECIKACIMAWEMDSAEVSVYLNGDVRMVDRIKELMNSNCVTVSQMNLPEHIAGSGLPLAASMLVFK